MQGLNQMFVDLSMPDTHVKDWRAASEAIRECAKRTEKLLSRSASCAHTTAPPVAAALHPATSPRRPA